MVNQLLQVMTLLNVELDILFFHEVTNVVVKIAKWFGNWDIHLFDPSD